MCCPSPQGKTWAMNTNTVNPGTRSREFEDQTDPSGAELINSPDRCDRVTRMLLAGRGDASCLQPRASVRRSSDSRPRSIR